MEDFRAVRKKTVLKSSTILFISLTLFILSESRVGDDCGPYMEHIVSGENGVPDKSISASSIYDNHPHHDPEYGRLYLYNPKDAKYPSEAWTAHYSNTEQYIQVAFAKPMIVCAVLAQGREILYQWVTSFAVLRSLDGTNWYNVKNTDGNDVFNGNTDRKTVVRNDFRECIEANYMRINPRTWEKYVSIRMDFLGCSKVRQDFLLLKRKTKCRFWKRSAVFKDKINQLEEYRSLHLGSCAIRCQQTSRCESYTFVSNSHNCVLFTSGNSQSSTGKSYVYTKNIDYLAQTNDYVIKSNGTQPTYYKIITELKTKGEAFKTCAEDGAFLLVIDNSEKMAFIQDDMKRNLILAQQTEYFIDGGYSEGEWVFNTQMNVPENLWSSAYPVTDNGTCIVVTATGLKTKDCQSQLYFVCQM